MLASTFVGSKLSGSSFLAGRQLQQQRAAAPAVPLGPLTIEAAHKKGAGSTKSECQHDSGVLQQAAEESSRRQSGCRRSTRMSQQPHYACVLQKLHCFQLAAAPQPHSSQQQVCSPAASLNSASSAQPVTSHALSEQPSATNFVCPAADGRDSVSKRRGVKVYGGQPVNAGGIIIRQLGTKVGRFTVGRLLWDVGWQSLSHAGDCFTVAAVAWEADVG